MKNIFLHGALASKQQFEICASLYDGEWIYPDLPGHGSSPLAKSQTISVDTLLSEVKQILTQEVQVNIFGYSLGGYLALLLAHQFPNQVNKVVTLGTIIHWDENIYTREAAFLNPGFLLEKVPAFVESLGQLHQTPWKSLLVQTDELLKDITTHQYLTPKTLSEISAEVYMLVGEKDKSAGVEASREAASYMPHARFEILPNTPHPFEKTDRQLLSEKVNAFLKG